MTGFRVELTGYGRAAVELLSGQVEELKGGDPLAGVTVVVPSNYAAVSIRRALAARAGGVANVTFLTLFRLGERLGSRRLTAAGRRPVNQAVLGQAVRHQLATDPGVFAPVADHASTELAVVSAVRELWRVSEAALDAVAETGTRGADVVRIARAVGLHLAPCWYDEEDLLQAATAAAETGMGWGGPLIPHLLQEIPNAAGELLRALASGQTVWVNVGCTGSGEADLHVWEAHSRVGIDVAQGGSAGVQRPVARRIVSASDPDEEVRAAVRVVTEWASQGRRLGRIAVLYGQADPYARILHEQLEASGLPHNGSPVRTLGDMLLGRAVGALLALPERNYRRSDVMAFLAGAEVRDKDRLAPSRAWERLSRAAEVVDGDDWNERLARFAADLRSRAEAAEGEDQVGLARGLLRDAEWADGLGEFVRRLRAEVDEMARASSWGSMAKQLDRMIGLYLGDQRRRLRWPQDEQSAAERVEGAVERLGGLDAVVGPPPTLDTFRRALEVELEAALPRVGHLGDGVFTSHVASAVGLDLDCVIVLGLAEGSLPSSRMEDSILSDELRRATGGELTERREIGHDDHRYLLAAIGAAEERVLTFPRGDMRNSGERAASRWLLEDARVLSGKPDLNTDDLDETEGPWLTVVPSFAAGLVEALACTAQEVRLAAMTVDAGAVVAEDGVLGAGMALARARRSEGFTRFDGNLGGCELPDYAAGGATSVSRLQLWAECPHAFLLRHLLGVEPVEDPERRLEMTKLDKGTLVHEILDRFIKEQIALEAQGPWEGEALVRLLAIGEEVCEEFAQRGLTGRRLFWRRDRGRILADLRRFAASDAGRPVRSELTFDAVAFPLPDGRRVVFKGAIDRVDRVGEVGAVGALGAVGVAGWAGAILGVEGAFRVIDYKTGKTDDYKSLTPEEPHDGGKRLQLPVYGAAVMQRMDASAVEARFWFVTARGEFKQVGYPITPEVMNATGAAIAIINDGIAAGVFPLHPPAGPSYAGYVRCWYCAPDGLSTAEVGRAWERKRSDATLRAYAALAGEAWDEEGLETEALDGDGLNGEGVGGAS